MQKSLPLTITGLVFVSGITAASQQELHRTWSRLESAHFIVYTAGEVSDAVNAVEQLEAVRTFVQSSLNIRRIPDFDVTVVVFDGRQDLLARHF